MDDKLKMELKDEIESVVATIFSEKEQTDIRKKTEAALQESAEKIQELTTCVEERNEEITGLTEKVGANEEKIQGLETELEAAKQETEDANEKLGEAETALEELKKDRAAEIRMVELTDAKVVGSDDQEAQLAKIREMSDEEFATYRDERIALRKAVIDELAAASAEEDVIEPIVEEPAAAAEEEEVAEEEAEEEEVAEEEVAEEEDEGLEPAQIDPGQAVAAALNMEIVPSADMKSKYAEMGNAMADLMTKKQEIEV